MEASEVVSARHISEGIDETMAEQYASQAKLLKEFSNITDFEKAWVFKSGSGGISRAMFCLGQADLLTDKKRISVLSSHISKNADHTVNFDWSPFPIELQGVSAAAVVPSPSGSKLLMVRNDNPIQLEVWGPSMLQKVIHVPRSVHGTIFTDGWFEGISWNKDECFVAYVAEEPCPSRPAFDNSGFKKDSSADSECGSWKGQGEYEEHWGKTYSEKRRPGLFVLDIESGEVRSVNGISKLLSVGQVVWAPSSTESYQDLVFVGWPSDIGPNNSLRKLGMK